MDDPSRRVLTRGMARVRGVNLVEAVIDGWLTRAELGRLVDRCASCPSAARCSGWLAVTVQADALPAYCRIRAEVESLRA